MILSPLARYVIVGERHLRQLDYTHSEKVNPFGTGEAQEFSMTFSYSLETLIPGFPVITKPFKGEAVAILDPHDGEWKLERLELNGQGSREFLELINSPTFQIRGN